MRQLKTGAFLLAALAIGTTSAAAALAQAPQFVHASASATHVLPGKPFTVLVHVRVDKPYHIQANPPKAGYIATEVVMGHVNGLSVKKVIYPKGQIAHIAGDILPVYEGSVTIKVLAVASRPLKGQIPFELKYQGCNDVTCYPPSDLDLHVALTAPAKAHSKAKKARRHAGIYDGYLILAQSQKGVQTGSDSLSVPGFRTTKITQFLAPADFISWLRHGGSQQGKAGYVAALLTRGGAGNFAVALSLIFLLGLALNLTPCVYPIIPITIGYFGRQAASGMRTGGLSVCYALGIAVMYTALGLVAALFGKVFGSQLSNSWVLLAFAVLMFGLGLSMFDRRNGTPIWELQLPSFLRGKAQSRSGYVGAGLMGLMVGVVAAPCIGPIVVALIQVVSSSHSVGLGVVTFFTLGAGLALPYLLLGFGLVKALPRAGEWMVSVKHIFGLLLFGMAIYYLQGLLPVGLYRTLFITFGVAGGLWLAILDKAGNASRGYRVFKRGAGLVMAAGTLAFFVRPAAPPTGSEVRFQAPADYAAMQRMLQQARAHHQEVLIDFSASWCAACKELDEKTFHNAQVATATRNFVAMRFHLEDFSSPYTKPFLKTFGIAGLPTVIHLVPAA
ncbi:MAG: thioredoxin family protein [Armatimonadetes bacterium]|nr:thioredoxin family protein [Armatimonadota bacterium]MDE2205786.1 thioredoxin family protein [Armatimonadota bacterium]